MVAGGENGQPTWWHSQSKVITSPLLNWRANFRNIVVTRGMRRLIGAQQKVYLGKGTMVAMDNGQGQFVKRIE